MHARRHSVFLTRLSWQTLLLWAFLFISTWQLKMSVSFHDLTKTMTKPLARTLVSQAMYQPSNIPTILLLARYGDNGLHDVVKDYNSHVSHLGLCSLLPWYVKYPEFHSTLFPEGFLDKIAILYKSFDFVKVDPRVVASLKIRNGRLQDMERLEAYNQADPSGSWWAGYYSRHGLPQRLASKTILYTELILILGIGMLDLLNSSLNKQAIASLYAQSSRMNHADPVKAMWSLYGLIRSQCLFPKRIALGIVQDALERFISIHSSIPEYETVLRLARLWLSVFARKLSEIKAEVMLHEMIDGDCKVAFGNLHSVYMNVMICIVFGSKQFNLEQRGSLVDRLVDAILEHDDLAVSNFVWHSALLPGCNDDSQCMERMMADGRLCTRLMRIPPFRKDEWDSVLLGTKYGIAYFRRWLAVYPHKRLLRDLNTFALGDRDLLDILSSVPYNVILPESSFDLVSVRVKLEGFIEALLKDPSCPYDRRLGENGISTWISLRRGFHLRTEEPQWFHVPSLVLRLHLHHYGLADMEHKAISYGLCRDLVKLVKATQWSPAQDRIREAVDIVYYQTSSETEC